MQKNAENIYFVNNSAAVLLIKIILSVFLILLTAAPLFSVKAFSDYEENTADKLFEDLNQRYEIKEFSKDDEASIILDRLEKNIVKKKFEGEDFKVYKILDDNINAYYIGAGNILIFEGLLKELNSNTQLAGLIAHEMGHGISEHLYEDMQRNLGLTILNILFNEFTDSQYQTMTNVFQTLISRGYSREQEREADIYAVDLMMRSGYNPQGLVDLMILFKEKSSNVKLLEFTQTHPIPESRIEYLNEYIAEKRNSDVSKIENPSSRIEEDSSKKNQSDKKSAEKNLKFIRLEKSLNDDIIKLSYPKNWELEKEDQNNIRTDFKYLLKADNLEGEFLLQDLSGKNFMESARKYYEYALITLQEEGHNIENQTTKEGDINIYKISWNHQNRHIYEYYLESDKYEKMLKLKFDFNRNYSPDRELILQSLINSVKFK